MVQCFAFLSFLPPLASFGLVTPMAVGIRVLGVEYPEELNCSREEGYKAKHIPLESVCFFGFSVFYCAPPLVHLF